MIKRFRQVFFSQNSIEKKKKYFLRGG